MLWWMGPGWPGPLRRVGLVPSGLARDRRGPWPSTRHLGRSGGLFHSVLHAQDSHHARLHRAAALATWRQVQSVDRIGATGRSV